MPTLEVQLWGSDTPQLVQITLTDVPAGSRVQIRREVAGLDAARVRGAYSVTVTTGALIVLDGSAPPGRPAVYTATITAPDGSMSEVSAGPITVPDPATTDVRNRHYLSDPATGRTIRVDVLSDPDERVNAARGSMLPITGRTRPVALWDHRDSDRGTLIIITDDRMHTRDIERLLAAGGPIVSRHTADQCDIPATEVLHILDARRVRWGRHGRRIWSLEFQVIDDPDPNTPIPARTLGDLAAYMIGKTLADFETTWPTLLDIAQDDLIEAAP